MRHQIDRHVHAAAHRGAQRGERDARQRLLARRVNVGQHDVVGALERRPEGVHQRRGTREPVRLECDDDPAAERPGRREHRGDLGRVMTVVVDDQNAVRLAAHVESPFHATELGQSCSDPFERQSKLQADHDGRQGVLEVVAARHVQRDRAKHLSAGAAPTDD